MKLIVGLGNPGRLYCDSRHNSGFAVVRDLAKSRRVRFRRDSAVSSLCGKGSFDSQDVILAMPLTYMNLSGSAVVRLMTKYAACRDELLVVCDDLDLEAGALRIRKSGSSGGHKGLASIMQALGTKDFARLRIGIGRPEQKDTRGIRTQSNRMDWCAPSGAIGQGTFRATVITDYVLSRFTRQEKKILLASVERAVDCCLIWITDGIDKSMNIFNRRDTPP